MLEHTCMGLMKGNWLGSPWTWGSLIACLASNVSNYHERELVRIFFFFFFSDCYLQWLLV